MDEWWRIEGVVKPVYVNLKTRKNVGLVATSLFILGVVLGEISGFLPGGVSILVSTIILLGEGILNYMMGLGRLKLGKTDIVFIQNMLKELSSSISRWSIPSINIPVVAVTNRGSYVLVYYRKGKLEITCLKPIVYYKVVRDKPKILFKTIRKTTRRINNHKAVLGVYEVVFPHPEIQGMNYNVRARAIILEQYLNPSTIRKIVEEFDNYFTGEKKLWWKYS